MKPIIFILALTAHFVFAAGCSGQPQQEFTDKKLVIPANQTIKLKEIDLSLTNKGCGRKWIAEKDKPSYEQPYCELEIRYRDSTIHAGEDFKPIYIGNLEITIDRINPWGREEDSIPPGGCRVFIKKLPDQSR